MRNIMKVSMLMNSIMLCGSVSRGFLCRMCCGC